MVAVSLITKECDQTPVRLPGPVPVGGEDPEKNDVILARGAAAADTGGVRAAGSIDQL